MPEGTEVSTPATGVEAEATPTTTETPEPESKPTGKDPSAEVEKWKSLSRKHEAEAKANAEAAKKLAEIEEANKSESQKLIDKAAKAEGRIADLERQLVRERVARRHNLSDDQMRRLVGETEEELEADAVEFLKMLVPEEEEQEEVSTPPSLTASPRPKLKSPSTPPVPLNGDPLLSAVKSKLGIR